MDNKLIDSKNDIDNALGILSVTMSADGSAPARPRQKLTHNHSSGPSLAGNSFIPPKLGPAG